MFIGSSMVQATHSIYEWFALCGLIRIPTGCHFQDIGRTFGGSFDKADQCHGCTQYQCKEQGDYWVEHLTGNISEQADQAQDEYILLDSRYQEIWLIFRRHLDIGYYRSPFFMIIAITIQ